MDSVNVKEILNEIYQQGLTLGLAAAMSMVLQKLLSYPDTGCCTRS